MALTWNNEYFVALEGRDLQCTAMAVDSTGTLVLLPGRRYTAIRNLNEECDVIQKFGPISSNPVVKAEWNPTSQNRELFFTNNLKRLDILSCHNERIQPTYTLKPHTSRISDVNWHQINPYLLATCSIDKFIHIWDLRDTRRPATTFAATSGAFKVQWNRISSNLIATAHEGDLMIWDHRNIGAPFHYVSAHLAKIHSIDWNPFNETQLTTSSQDNTVKFFDTTNPRKPEYVLTTNAPVWRAKYTPFGNGLVTAVVPQSRRGESSLLLWNSANRATPMHTFVGHRDVVLEFDWRKKPPDDTQFQLVTWSRDQTLLIWKIEPFLQKLCGYDPDESKEVEEVNIDIPNPNKMKKKASVTLQPLQQEFSLLNIQIPNLEIKNTDAVARTCEVQAEISAFTVILLISFPNGYPHGVPPVFELAPNSTVTDLGANQVLQTLNHLAQQRVSKNRTCLEACLRHLVVTLEQLSRDSESDSIFEASYIEPTNAFGGFNDAYIPFPKTSGAKFCSANILVCFNVFHSKRLTKTELTPRALSAFESVYSKHAVDHLSLSSSYFQKQKQKGKYSSSKSFKAAVHLYDCSSLFFVNRKLAEEYILNGDISTVCRHNGAAAAVVGRWDLVQAWTLAELVMEPRKVDNGTTWDMHPFSSCLMQSLIDHYAKQSDIQMAALLCCIFRKAQDQAKKIASEENQPKQLSIDIISEGWVFPSLKYPLKDSLESPSSLELAPDDTTNSICSAVYDHYKLAYAETLHRWGLLFNRAEVLKYVTTLHESPKRVGFLTNCKNCQKPTKFSSCLHCKKLSMMCVICHISVWGAASCCVICGHGGHTSHLQNWFKKSDICPSGCGCKCIQEMAIIFSV